MSLKNTSPSDTYRRLLNVQTGIDGTTRKVIDGDGNESSLSVSNNRILSKPVDSNNTTQFKIENLTGTELFLVDSTNSSVKALQNYVNTQFAYFGNMATNAFFSANTHHPVAFSSYYGASDLTNPPNFGTGTDPATSFTTAEGAATRASDLVPYLWYISDDIVIDSVCSLQGADTATGDVNRMHLMSYDLTSGSTTPISNGTVVANNSDVDNQGSEQPYLSNTSQWTVVSSSVTAGKVILAFFRSDSVNSDYSISIKVKYHLV
ncbi:MAG TPA: hypothetical protein DCM40_11280 [Maribacter sp.]|jgi:hypothetical protein|nr:hypothetical protein [Maribacter sp.]